MMDSGNIIQMRGISKVYRIGLSIKKTSTIKDAIVMNLRNRWQRLSGKGIAQAKNVTWALRDIDLDVKQGEILGIIGKNGTGKSTLLKILSKITEPTSGEAWINGSLSSLLEVGTGFHPELTGRENIFLNGAILGMTRNEIRSRFDEIVDFSGISTMLDTPVKRYSSGMYVRLAFSVAAHLESDILLVDEILSVGDAVFQNKCLGKMKDVVQNSQRTILFVSHNLQAVAKLCNRAIEIDDGKIASSGAVDDVIHHYLNARTDKLQNRPGVYTYHASKETSAYIKKVALKGTSGEPSDRFNIHESINITVEFTLRESINNLYLFGRLWKPGLMALMRMDELKWEERQGSQFLKEAPKKAGHYTASTIIPGNFFNIGEYELELFLYEPRVRRHNEVRGILFNLFDTRGISYTLHKEDPKELLVDARKWTIDRL